MEVNSVIGLSTSKGLHVKLTIGSHLTGVNVELDYSGRVTTYNNEYFAEVLAALVNGTEHVPDLPAYCQCEPCRTTRGKEFADRIAEAQARRLAQADGSREVAG